MENVLMARVRDAEAAQRLLQELMQRSGDDGFKLEAASVVHRDERGAITDRPGSTEPGGSATAVGTGIGAILGLFAGPLAAVAGGATGALVGSLVDASGAEDADRIVGVLARSLPPGSHGVVAVAAESSPDVLDRLVGDHGGSSLGASGRSSSWSWRQPRRLRWQDVARRTAPRPPGRRRCAAGARPRTEPTAPLPDQGGARGLRRA